MFEKEGDLLRARAQSAGGENDRRRSSTYYDCYFILISILRLLTLAVIYTGRNPWEFRIDWREFPPLFLAREFE